MSNEQKQKLACRLAEKFIALGRKASEILISFDEIFNPFISFVKLSTETMYSPLPGHVYAHADKLDIKSQQTVKKDFVDSFLKRHVPPNRVKRGELEEIKSKAQIIDNNVKKRVCGVNTKKRRKYLTAKEKRQLKLFDIDKQQHKFNMYLPLHTLWNQYIKDALQFKNVNDHNIQTAQAKLLKADYHGCLLTVQKSKCPSYIGTSGIVLQETRNTFKLITKEDKIKCIPKANSVFVFQIEGYCFTIHGNSFKVKSSERAVKKFKSKATFDLL